MGKKLNAVERAVAGRVLQSIEDGIMRYEETLKKGDTTVMINVLNSGVYVNATEAAVKATAKVRDILAGIRIFYTTK